MDGFRKGEMATVVAPKVGDIYITKLDGEGFKREPGEEFIYIKNKWVPIAKVIKGKSKYTRKKGKR